MNCDEVADVLGAYVLDALPAGEAMAVEAHLATCREHAAQARELRAVALALRETVEPVAAPPALRARIVAAVAGEPQLAAEGPRAATPTRFDPAVTPRRSGAAVRPSNIRGFPTYALGAVAAALIAVIGGLAAWNINLQTRLDDRLDPSLASAIAPLQGAPSATGRGAVVYFADAKKALVVGDDMPVLDGDKTYQLWELDGLGQQPRNIGLMRPDAGGHTSMLIDFDATAARTIAITVEPAGGSAQPTSDPVFTAKT